MNTTEQTVIATEAPFVIDSLERLGWYGRKLAAKQAELTTLNAAYLTTSQAIIKDLESFKAQFDPQAAEFTRQLIEASGGKRKSFNTLGGVFAFRTVRGGLRVTDKDAVLAWAREKAPDLIEREEYIKESVPATSLKKHLDQHGEIPDGCEIADDRESFSHKIETP